VDKYAVNAAALKFMVWHYYLPLATESLSSPPVTFHAFVCCCVVSNEWQVCHERNFWFHSRACILLDAVTALTVAPEDWIKTLAACSCEYNLLQESTATICLALLYILIESNHLWTIWVTLENSPYDPTSFRF
jgi:hypothetical protein